ncbi:MAG: hypothetical protein ACKOTB_17755 [Planctomycetia bacterium]
MTTMHETPALPRLLPRLRMPPADTPWRRTCPVATAFRRHTSSALVALAVATAASVAVRAQQTVAPDESRTAVAWVTPEIRAPGVTFHMFDSSAA